MLLYLTKKKKKKRTSSILKNTNLSEKPPVMSSKALAEIKECKVNIYELLQVPKDSNDTIIKKAYRKQALIYHPDKNPSKEAAEKFHFLSLALTILSDAQLRVEYDHWIAAQELLSKRYEQETSDRKRKREELIRAEEAIKREHTGFWSKGSSRSGSAMYSTEIERLREEGMRKRREYENEFLSKLSYSATIPKSTDNESNRTVKVRWKVKEGIADLFTDDVVEGIFSIFGHVEQVERLRPSTDDKRYETRKVVFSTSAAASRAVAHDFSVKSTIWDNTSYRKLSGLIREAKWLKSTNAMPGTGVLNKEQLTLQEYNEQTLSKLQKFDRVL